MTTTKKPRPWTVWRHKPSGKVVSNLHWEIIGKYDYREDGPDTVIDQYEKVNPDGFKFTASLKFAGLANGRAAVHFRFDSLEEDNSFLMTLGAFEDLVTRATLSQGCVRGIWEFEKPGATIGIRLVEEIEE